MDTSTKILIGVAIVGGGYLAYRALSSRPEIESDSVSRLPPGNSDDRTQSDTGNTEERIASGAFGLAREITRGIFAKVERDDRSREERAREERERARDTTDDYDPRADYERKRAA